MKFLLHESDYGRTLKAMTAMVRKLYPGFDAGRDFCLWLVPEFFDDTPSYRYFHPDVTLTDHSGQPVSPLPEKAVLLARYPYPNRCLFQAGVKYGAKRVFGVPFVFPGRDSLKEIHAVHTDCFCLYPAGPWQEERPRMLAVHHDFILDWQDATEGTGHWFTISRKEILHGPECPSGMTGGNIPGDAASALSRVREALEKSLPGEWKEYGLSMGGPVDMELRTGTTQVRMEPAPYADLIPDPCFGFRDIRE